VVPAHHEDDSVLRPGRQSIYRGHLLRQYLAVQVIGHDRFSCQVKAPPGRRLSFCRQVFVRTACGLDRRKAWTPVCHDNSQATAASACFLDGIPQRCLAGIAAVDADNDTRLLHW
jgi:hypothetical protein